MSRVLLGEDNVHGINCISFHEDSIIAGVSGPFVYHVLFSGDVTVKMPTTPLRVYNICLQKNDKKVTIHLLPLIFDLFLIFQLTISADDRWRCQWRYRYLYQLKIARSSC